MPWLLAAIAGIGAVEIFLRLPFAQTLYRFRSTVSKVRSVIASDRISDHWKERVIPAYAARLLRLTALTALYLSLILAPIIALVAVSAAAGIPLLEFTLSLTGLVYTSAVAIAYARVRTSVRQRL